MWLPLSRAARVLLTFYLSLALAYNFAQPPFEPSDEQYQFGYVHYVIEHRALPVAARGELSGYHHPPLFFLLTAAITWPFPTPDLADYDSRINPFARFRHWEPSVDNKNLYLHGPWDAWPFHSTALAVHVGRLMSLALGLITVALTYQIGRRVFDEAVGVAAAGLVAFTPMFTSLSGALQNDLGAAALGAVMLWLGVHWMEVGFTARRAALLGAVVGLAALMKLTGAFLAPAAALLVFASAWRKSGGRPAAMWLMAFAGGAALTAGWWFARNIALYGDPTAVNVNLDNFGGRTSIGEGIALWPEMLPYAWTTFWGRIGHGGIVLYDWMYQALAVFTLIAVTGLVRFARRDPHFTLHTSHSTFLLLTGLFSFLGLLIYITLSPTGANGRYAYPALPAYMTLLAAGTLSWVPAARRALTAWLLTGMMGLFSLGILLFFVWPAYALPPALAQLPAEAIPLAANLGDTARLRGFATSTVTARPGERVYLTLYWEPLTRTDQPYAVYVHLLGEDGVLIAQRDTYPGLGRNPTTAWEPGRLFVDSYLVIIPDNATAQPAQWKAGLWQMDSGDYAFLLDANGQPVESGVTFGGLEVRR